MTDSKDGGWDSSFGMEPPDEYSMDEAERLLESADDAPFSAEKVDRIVKSVIGRTAQSAAGGCDVPMAAVGLRRRLVRPTQLAAAGLAMMMLLSAGYAGYRLWPESRDSEQTLDFATAVAVLDDPGEGSARRRSARMRLAKLVEAGVSTLKAEANGGSALSEAARWNLNRIREIAFLESMVQTRKLSGDFLDSMRTVQSGEAADSARARALRHVAAQTATVMSVLVTVPSPDSGLEQQLNASIDSIREMLKEY